MGCSSGGGSTTAGLRPKTEAPKAESKAADKTEAAGSTEAAADDWKWERKVTIVCPWGVGGGADGTLRPLQPILEKELGVPVEIVNVEGAGGANGIDFTYKAAGGRLHLRVRHPVPHHAGLTEDSSGGL